MKDLDEFIQVTDKGLTAQVKEGDYIGLVRLMASVMAVKERQSATDEMFEPLRETIELLKAYDHDMSEDVHLQLQVRHCHLTN